MEMNYDYSKKDLLHNPQNYQRTSFEGKNFLLAYKESRRENIENLKNKIIQNKNFEEIINNFDIEKEMNSKNNTQKILKSILKENIYSKKDNEIVGIFIKKFEIKKRIFSSYDENWIENTLEYNSIINYILLSNICIIKYEETKKIKFLNVILKLNDLICSEIKNIKENTELNLVIHCLKKELNFIVEIKKRFSIS